jgi:hypothetical protein
MAKTRVPKAPPIMIRNSERQSYKRCEFQWAFNFGLITGRPLQPIEEGRALRFGDLIHQALAAYYKPGKKRGPHPSKTFLKLYNKQIEEMGRDRINMRDEEKWMDAEDLGPAMLEGYVDKYKEADRAYRVISSEQVFQVPIRVNFPDGKLRRVQVVGTLDGLWQRLDADEDQSFAFKEFKTATSIDLGNLPFDEQAGTYWTYAPRWLWKNGFMPKGIYPREIIYTFLRKAMPDEREENELGQKLNKDGTVSKKQPSARYERQPIYRTEMDRERMHERVQLEAIEMWKLREGQREPIKNPGPLFMPNCKFCAFRDPCELHETGGDWESMIRAAFTGWGPYDAHELPERW